MRIIFEDNHLLVINKDAGVLVQGDKTGDTPLSDLAKAYVKEKYQKPGEVFMGVIHRIDRPVSGLVLMARTSKALERMNEQFKNREIEKKYLDCSIGLQKRKVLPRFFNCYRCTCLVDNRLFFSDHFGESLFVSFARSKYLSVYSPEKSLFNQRSS